MKQVPHLESLDSLKDMFSQEEFKDALDFQKCFSVLEIMGSIWEREFSDILSWLLDPRESHHSGDFFLHYLIEELCQQKGIKNPNDIKKLFNNDSLIIPEYTFKNSPKAKSKKGFLRPDILCVSPESQSVIVIENKYGSKLNPRQLESYVKKTSKDFNGYKNFFFVYIDKVKFTGQKNVDWVYLTFDWLRKTIEKYFQKYDFDQSSSAHHLLKDVILEIQVDYEDDARYSKSIEAIRRIVTTYPHLIHEVKALQNISKNERLSSQIYQNYLRYENIFDKCWEYKNIHLHLLKSKVHELALKEFNFVLSFSLTDTKLYLTLGSLDELGGEWPIYLKYDKTKKEISLNSFREHNLGNHYIHYLQDEFDVDLSKNAMYYQLETSDRSFDMSNVDIVAEYIIKYLKNNIRHFKTVESFLCEKKVSKKTA